MSKKQRIKLFRAATSGIEGVKMIEIEFPKGYQSSVTRANQRIKEYRHHLGEVYIESKNTLAL